MNNGKMIFASSVVVVLLLSCVVAVSDDTDGTEVTPTQITIDMFSTGSLVLNPGTYTLNTISISGSFTISSSSGDPSSVTIILQAESTNLGATEYNISGVTFKSETECKKLYIHDPADDVKISNCIFVDSFLYVSSENLEISDCVMSHGSLHNNTRSVSAMQIYAEKLNISGNTIEGYPFGIAMNAPNEDGKTKFSSITVSNNVIKNLTGTNTDRNTNAIQFAGDLSNTKLNVSGNEVSGCVNGVVIHYSSTTNDTIIVSNSNKFTVDNADFLLEVKRTTDQGYTDTSSTERDTVKILSTEDVFTDSNGNEKTPVMMIEDRNKTVVSKYVSDENIELVPPEDSDIDEPVTPPTVDDDDELPFIPPQSGDDGGADTTTYVAVAAAAAVVAILAVLAVGISKGKL